MTRNVNLISYNNFIICLDFLNFLFKMFKILPKIKPLSVNFLKKSNLWTSTFKNFKPINQTKANFTTEHSSQELTNKNNEQKGNL